MHINIFTVVGFVILLPITIPLFLGKQAIESLQESISRCHKCKGKMERCVCGSLNCANRECYYSGCLQCW